MKIIITVIAILIFLILFPFHAVSFNSPQEDENSSDSIVEYEDEEHYQKSETSLTEANRGESMTAMITGYNTVEAQTDSTPCIASGGNICGRDDVVACPREIPLFTWVQIEGKKYECMDRTHIRFNDRFDISCDKDMDCPFEVHRESAEVIVFW